MKFVLVTLVILSCPFVFSIDGFSDDSDEPVSRMSVPLGNSQLSGGLKASARSTRIGGGGRIVRTVDEEIIKRTTTTIIEGYLPDQETVGDLVAVLTNGDDAIERPNHKSKSSAARSVKEESMNFKETLCHARAMATVVPPTIIEGFKKSPGTVTWWGTIGGAVGCGTACYLTGGFSTLATFATTALSTVTGTFVGSYCGARTVLTKNEFSAVYNNEYAKAEKQWEELHDPFQKANTLIIQLPSHMRRLKKKKDRDFLDASLYEAFGM